MSKTKKEIELKPCPFCGDLPDVSSCGTQIDISCCVSMGYQKSDCMTLAERETFINAPGKYCYCDEAETRAMSNAIADWNHRTLDTELAKYQKIVRTLRKNFVGQLFKASVSMIDDLLEKASLVLPESEGSNEIRR